MINILNPFRRYELCTYKGSQAMDLHMYASIHGDANEKNRVQEPRVESEMRWFIFNREMAPFIIRLGYWSEIQLVVRRWVAYDYRKMNQKTLRQGISFSLKRSGAQPFADLYDWQHLHVAKITLINFCKCMKHHISFSLEWWDVRMSGS